MVIKYLKKQKDVDMKTFKLLNYIWLLAFVLLFACEQDLLHKPLNIDDKIPSQVRNPVVKNIPGGAIISYDLPQDITGLLYVKAECEIRPGVIREVKASYYKTSLTIDGLGDTIAYDINLYSVGRNDKMSEPIKLEIEPLTPPIWEVYKSLSVNEDWGGISFTFKNDLKADIVLEVFTKDVLDRWISVENFYTKRDSAKFAIRGFDPIETEFGITVRDRWLNRTDTLVGLYTPWKEEKLNKKLFKKLALPTDYTELHQSGPFESIFDDIYADHGWVSKPDVSGVLGGGMPQWFTIDLGVTTRLSRLVVFYPAYGTWTPYASGCPDRFEIWGSTNPSENGSWDDSWTLLRECKAVKPSGLPAGQYSQEDLEYAQAGDEFTFENAPPIRYLRWKTLSNQAKSSHVHIAELDLFGNILD